MEHHFTTKELTKEVAVKVVFNTSTCIGDLRLKTQQRKLASGSLDFSTMTWGSSTRLCSWCINPEGVKRNHRSRSYKSEKATENFDNAPPRSNPVRTQRSDLTSINF
jgi:hypothetical protein